MTTSDDNAKMGMDIDDNTMPMDDNRPEPSHERKRNWDAIVGSPAFGSSASVARRAKKAPPCGTSGIDASTINPKEVKELIYGVQNAGYYFTNCSVSSLDIIFPKKKHKGQNDPPMSFRTTATKMRTWRKMGKKEQTTALAGERLEPEPSEATPAQPCSCHGLSLEFLLSMAKRKDPMSLEIGFCTLIAEAKHNAGTACNRQHHWPLDPKKFHGVLDLSSAKKEQTTDDIAL